MNGSDFLKKGHLFNVADEAIVNNIKYNDFQRSLFDNVLFDDGIVLHEAAFFNSSYLLKEHILNDNKKRNSFFEEAAIAGLAVPTISRRDIQSIEFLVKYLKHDKYDPKKDYFEEEILNSKRVKKYIKNLDKGLSSTGNVIYWPEGVGKGYEELVKEKFYNIKAPIFGNENITKKQRDYINNVWKISEPWRNECFEDALEETLKIDPKGGLRRGELFSAIKRKLKIENPEKYTNLEDILKVAKLNQNEVDGLKAFWSWLNQCYHINLSKKINVQTNLPNYNYGSDFLGEEILFDNTFTREEYEIYQFDWDRPTVDYLAKINPKKLIQLRCQNVGKEYFHARQEFFEKPNYSNAKQKVKYLQEYSDEIFKLDTSNPKGKIKIPIGLTTKKACQGAGVLLNYLSETQDGSLPVLRTLGHGLLIIGILLPPSKISKPNINFKDRESLKIEFKIQTSS